ncbi:DUF2779 domain-containing protein [Rhodanobacter sp. FDAARGOS 1247]|uniref:DUF2779 domain-containing protein n=1 Tax=Rhodanobacter sp. FDAARGOS 1247 TaxID=2778082 RepID=UPI00194F9D9C|nr:DUF2779 domain-containing protein [Rhodanobacter sp. FDAARGOS 1247]QRP64092.1 DUF2779 domain-containing protein [Rhodanobacter sp. FDAARGOS 1247]
MPSTAPRLSKTRMLSGRQCKRRLWLETHRRELGETDAATQAAFDSGNAVGELARLSHGPGHLIGHVHELDAAFAETAALLARKGRRQTLFEAAFQHDDVVVRADVLKPAVRGYDLIEVKASTEVKDYHLIDCAIQAWVIDNAGVPLRRIRLAHIDNGFVYTGHDDYRGLLVDEDITNQVRDLMPEVAGWVRTQKRTLRGNEPAITTGEHCQRPFPCPFFDHCRAQEPAAPKYPVTILPHAGKLVRTLVSEGYLDLRKVPAARLANPRHRRIRTASISGRRHLDPAAADIVGRLGYPRHYLDFETIDFAIPRWPGTRPYQQIPFQWSCHVERRDGSLKERLFLDLSGKPPMRAFAASLLGAVGRHGPILVYNQAFEAARVRELAVMLPELADDLLALNARMIDLLPITREHYYHPAMMGSWSIKAVLPTIAADLDYARLPHVADGGQAQLAYLEAIHAETTARRRSVIDKALRRYCGYDTLAMVRLVRTLAQA